MPTIAKDAPLRATARRTPGGVIVRAHRPGQVQAIEDLLLDLLPITGATLLHCESRDHWIDYVIEGLLLEELPCIKGEGFALRLPQGGIQLWKALDLDIAGSFRKNTAPDWIRHRPIAADWTAAELAAPRIGAELDAIGMARAA